MTFRRNSTLKSLFFRYKWNFENMQLPRIFIFVLDES